MAMRKQTSMVDGQNSDEMGAKDKLVDLTIQHTDPYRARGNDFPVKNSSLGKAGMAEGRNELVDLSKNQEGPRMTQGWSGDRSDRDSMGANAQAVDANFKVERNKGESGVAPVSPDLADAVDLASGRIEVRGARQDKVMSVADRQVEQG
jgi:hypothetical protein